MEHKQYSLEELPNMLEEEQTPEKLNKIMSAISNKYDVLSDDMKRQIMSKSKKRYISR